MAETGTKSTKRRNVLLGLGSCVVGLSTWGVTHFGTARKLAAIYNATSFASAKGKVGLGGGEKPSGQAPALPTINGRPPGITVITPRH